MILYQADNQFYYQLKMINIENGYSSGLGRSSPHTSINLAPHQFECINAKRSPLNLSPAGGKRSEEDEPWRIWKDSIMDIILILLMIKIISNLSINRCKFLGIQELFKIYPLIVSNVNFLTIHSMYRETIAFLQTKYYFQNKIGYHKGTLGKLWCGKIWISKMCRLFN